MIADSHCILRWVWIYEWVVRHVLHVGFWFELVSRRSWKHAVLLVGRNLSHYPFIQTDAEAYVTFQTMSEAVWADTGLRTVHNASNILVRNIRLI